MQLTSIEKVLILLDSIKNSLVKTGAAPIEISNLIKEVTKIGEDATFEEVAMSVIKHLNNGDYHPHHSVVITSSSAELVEGVKMLVCAKHIKD